MMKTDKDKLNGKVCEICGKPPHGKTTCLLLYKMQRYECPFDAEYGHGEIHKGY